MRTSDHPAAKPRQYRPPVFRADDEPVSISPDRLAEIAAIPDDAIDTSDIPDGSARFAGALAGEPENWQPTPEPGESGTGDVPLPTREPIASAPQDGSYLRAFWGPDDETGRLVRWREGRHFNNRRWVTGGTWAPADGMVPLPAELPSEWLKPPEDEPAEAEEEAA